MAEQAITFEQVDAAMKKLAVVDYQPGGKAHFTAVEAQANAAAVLPKICPVYKAIRPILVALSGFPIPTTWQGVIKTFIALMDALCA